METAPSTASLLTAWHCRQFCETMSAPSTVCTVQLNGTSAFLPERPGSASPSDTPTATNQAIDPDDEETPDGSGPSRRGTYVALALAGALALAAGAITYFVKK